tara:strand:- start:2075 stop:2488 length:414 start_codon:yes stop_codon:yes gene_type:complete
MKKFILILLFLPLFSNAQYIDALSFQNSIRSYYNLNPYIIDINLNNQAQAWANQIALTDEFNFSPDTLGETLYYFKKTTGVSRPNNVFLDAAVSWAIDADEASFNQTICSNCSSVGYGISENIEYIYIVAKYDKLWQ